MKYALFVFLAVFCLFCAPSLAHATSLLDYDVDLPKDAFQGTVIMAIGQERLFINGNEASGDKPFLEQGRTMAPLRTIGEAFGAKVDWSAQDNKVTVTLNGQKVELTLGSKDMYVNGVQKELDVAAKSYSGRTYLPLRAIGEALGKSVSYVGDYSLILISSSPPPDPTYWSNILASPLYNPRYPEIFSWAIEGKKILYSDDYIVVYYKDDGSLYLKYWAMGYDKEYPFKTDQLTGANDIYNTWYSTRNGRYLVLNTLGGEEATLFIYLYQDGNLKRVYGPENIYSIRFTNDYMYIVVGRMFGDGGWPVHLSSNLLKVSLQDYTGEYLGLTGYVYGVVLTSDGTFEKDEDWQVKDDGVYISSFYDIGTNAERYGSAGRYKVSLTGQSHEKLTP